MSWVFLFDMRGISIHALREEGDARRFLPTGYMSIFLSTPSARRATSFCIPPSTLDSHFYPRPPRGGRHADCANEKTGQRISIHALREEGDVVMRIIAAWSIISIHALREEGDICTKTFVQHFVISIHALREEGDTMAYHSVSNWRISIHALREEGDTGLELLDMIACYFYPRPPRGGRQQKQRQNLYFLINYTTFCTNLEEL